MRNHPWKEEKMSENLDEHLFWSVHQDLPREGPGDDASTLRAYQMLTDLPPQPRILDIGCGPGAQTIVLVQASQGRVTAVDTHQPFLDDLANRAAQAGVTDRIEPVRMSMFDLHFEQPFDLLWSEGAIYIIGFEEGLRAWRPLLKPGGCAAVTEATWLKPNAPEAVTKFWAEAYPEMGTLEENRSRTRRAGYRLIDHFTLPESAWWENYYDPMATRIAKLREDYADNPEALRLLDMESDEIELYRQYAEFYGYVFYIMQVDDHHKA